jgi:signal transduction histidine kinase
MMKLSRKNFIYSFILAGILMLLTVGYFIFMLPSLYVKYVEDRHLRSITDQHQYYLEHNSYDEISVNNLAGCFSIDIPLHENFFYFTNKAVRARLDANNEQFESILDEMHAMMIEVKENPSLINDKNWMQDIKNRAKTWGDAFTNLTKLKEELPVSISILESQDYASLFSNATTTFHLISDDTIIVTSGVTDQNNSFSNYIAVTINDDRFVVSYLPVVTPQMNEILPVVLGSLPMIIAVLILIVLIFSQIYSKGIVVPIVQLVNHTKSVKFTGIRNAHVPKIEGYDEVTTLASTLNELYAQLRESYSLLEEKNRMLEDENKRKEIFLRSSSHQLKTPIAAALLLLDGIMNQVGKYKDTAQYLPQVKEQLLSMKNIVEDILYLNHCEDHIQIEHIELMSILKDVLARHQIAMSTKDITLMNECNPDFTVQTDEHLITKIIDNLIANAVAYTPDHSQIRIQTAYQTDSSTVEIKNLNAHIEEDLLEHIFEPFVSGNTDNKCHGLGLYIVDYYAQKLHIDVTITNACDGVIATITFKKPTV